MPQLPDGTVVPSFMGIERTPPMSDGISLDNFRLRVGEIQDVVYPDDKRSLSKRFVEYRVLVQQRDGRVGAGKIYENCVLGSLFGGIADKFSYTLRADTTQAKTRGGLGRGSKVLVLCVNGETSQSVIVGGLRDQTDSDSDSKGKGHHLLWNFNGVEVTVNNDGELTATYKGATAIDGTTSASGTGTYLKLLKNGNAVLSDASGANALTIDHANSQVTIARDKAFLLGSATDYMLLGQTFRTQQQVMNNTMSGLFTSIQALMVVAGAQLLAAGAANVPAIIGGILAAPFFVAAAAAFTAMGPLMGQLGQAIQAFETAGKPFNGYLSQKNKAD